jgi:hypothetical protein
VGLDSSDVQALSAVAIAVLTGALIWFTRKYVKKTGDIVTAQRDANRIQERYLERTLLAEAPSVRFLSVGNRSVPGDGTVTSQLILTNLGRTTAYEVVVHTDWGDGEAPFIEDSEQRRVNITTDEASWVKGTDPLVQRIDFNDRLGNRWEQEPTGPPRLMDS